MLKIIFLDIDGVLNPYAYTKAMYKLREQHGNQIKTMDFYGVYFAPYCVDALAKIIKATNAKIVISSTWRKSGINTMQELWKHRKLEGEIYDVTPVLNLMRGHEVDEWMRENTVDNYVIIDDDDDFLPEQNFVKTDSKIGLTDELADKVIAILNRKY